MEVSFVVGAVRERIVSILLLAACTSSEPPQSVVAPPLMPKLETTPTPQPVALTDAPAAPDERPDPQTPVVDAPAKVVPEGCWEGDGQRWDIEAGDAPRVVMSPSGKSAPLQYRASDQLFGFKTHGRHEGLVLFRCDGERIEAYPHSRRGRGEWRRSGFFALTPC